MPAVLSGGRAVGETEPAHAVTRMTRLSGPASRRRVRMARRRARRVVGSARSMAGSVSSLRRANRSAAGGPPPRRRARPPSRGGSRARPCPRGASARANGSISKSMVEPSGSSMPPSARSTVSEASGSACEQRHQPRVRRRIDHDRQHPVLEAVVAEDVRVRGRDDRPDAPGGQGPRRVLARRTGPEVVADQQDLASGHPRPIEDERRVLQRPVLLEPPVPEQRLGEAGLVGDLEIAGRARSGRCRRSRPRSARPCS